MPLAATTNADFWNRAPSLFELANSATANLATSELTEDIRLQVKALASEIPETPEALGEVDPYLQTALLTAVIHGLRAAEDDDRTQLRIALERIRQSLRDMLDERPVWEGGPKNASVWLRLRGLQVPAIATIVGASESSVRRWSNPEDDSEPSSEHAERVVVVAKIVNHLRHAMTPLGAIQWLQRPHPQLGDRRPIDELKDVDSYRRLVALASGTRSFVAT
ncbi:MAG: DUF2384 domain-containing protein [Acidimicrobiia bacterium]|nr:DUF2384 domain-containing protein [Acidimicrobiia bacterium]